MRILKLNTSEFWYWLYTEESIAKGNYWIVGFNILYKDFPQIVTKLKEVLSNGKATSN